MLLALAYAGVLVGAVWSLVAWLVSPPAGFPKSIPTVPFYVGILPLLKDVDQLELYRKYFEKHMRRHGAVKMFFGGRWNVLVGNYGLLQEVFKQEHVYQKSGNQMKIPYSVLAEYLGDNIISAHGSNWSLYTSVMKPGLQRQFSLEPLTRNTEKLLRLMQEQTGRPLMVGPLLQRYSLANLSNSLLGVDFGTLEDPSNSFHKLQVLLKQAIFEPLFMTFPLLDTLSFPSRLRARQLVRQFRAELQKAVLASHEHITCSLESEMLSERMVAAHRTGVWTDKQFQDNLLITFVAGHENPQIMMVSLLYLLGKHTDIQDALRAEVRAAGGAAFIPDRKTLKSSVLLTSIIYEALRLLPPLSQLVNRRVDADTALGGRIAISAGTYVGYHCYSVCQDPQLWGADAATFRPGRWGGTTDEVHARYRQAKSKAQLPTFHGGRRACLGEAFALLELHLLLWLLVGRVSWRLDPDWKESMTPAGPLYPKALRIIVDSVE